jgi:hypothetical protein
VPTGERCYAPPGGGLIILLVGGQTDEGDQLAVLQRCRRTLAIARAAPPTVAARTRIASAAGIRLNHRKSLRPFKGIFCHDISEFESYMPSHAVGSLWRVYPVHCEQSAMHILPSFARCTIPHAASTLWRRAFGGTELLRQPPLQHLQAVLAPEQLALEHVGRSSRSGRPPDTDQTLRRSIGLC